jgi:hypothetical protein
VLTVVPSLGGRVVALGAPGGENLLLSDPATWHPPYPPPALETPFRPWNGRIVWVGPQSGFWAQQDVAPERARAKPPWPPDPFNETGRFEVVEHTAKRLVLKGSESPVTGLSFVHEYELTGARARMKTTATNRRKMPVSWDLWPNTRVRPEGHAYVKLAGESALRLDGPKGPAAARAGAYPMGVQDGWLVVEPGHAPAPGQGRLFAKAFVRPAADFIAFFLGRRLLLVRAPLVPIERLHPEQAFVEIYRGAAKGEDILELEMHGPYETLLPGASTSFEQTFELLDYDGPADVAGHLRRLTTLPSE